jgi:hypothetical protein
MRLRSRVAAIFPTIAEAEEAFSCQLSKTAKELSSQLRNVSSLR